MKKTVLPKSGNEKTTQQVLADLAPLAPRSFWIALSNTLKNRRVGGISCKNKSLSIIP
jgi:hypothetical protein